MDCNEQRLLQAKILVDRLARLSADSTWAHRASGVRASIDKLIEKATAVGYYNPDELDILINRGFDVIEKAAQEIPTPDEALKGFQR